MSLLFLLRLRNVHENPSLPTFPLLSNFLQFSFAVINTQCARQALLRVGVLPPQASCQPWSQGKNLQASFNLSSSQQWQDDDDDGGGSGDSRTVELESEEILGEVRVGKNVLTVTLRKKNLEKLLILLLLYRWNTSGFVLRMSRWCVEPHGVGIIVSNFGPVP